MSTLHLPVRPDETKPQLQDTPDQIAEGQRSVGKNDSADGSEINLKKGQGAGRFGRALMEGKNEQAMHEKDETRQGTPSKSSDVSMV